MYTNRNYKTKKALKEAVEAWNKQEAAKAQDRNQWLTDVLNGVKEVHPVTLYAPGLGTPNDNGKEFVSGPHYPEPHRWYAEVTVKNGIVVKVK